jgi:hypothetical protein
MDLFKICFSVLGRFQIVDMYTHWKKKQMVYRVFCDWLKWLKVMLKKQQHYIKFYLNNESDQVPTLIPKSNY